MNKEKHVRIVVEQVQNGYMVMEHSVMSGSVAPVPYVFETFESMIEWMRGNFAPHE